MIAIVKISTGDIFSETVVICRENVLPVQEMS
ncbi:hypothetical protein BH20ACI2_BH20ACI2_09490 [soil metagenome]